MASEDVLALLTGGKFYSGWKSVSVMRSMEHCSGAFRLGVSDLWPGQSVANNISPGEKCEVLIGTDTAITGYIDAVDVEIDDSKHDITVAGRDATADLVDCSAVRKTGQWRGQKIERIAQDLCAPFGIAVRAEVDTGAALDFALNIGETVFEAIERAARIRALLLMSDGKGALLITRAGEARAPTALVLGENVLSAKMQLDLRDRFSSYTLLGQTPGSDDWNGVKASQVRAVAVDEDVKRHRPLLMTNDTSDLAATLKQRAQWESNVRAARSTEIEVVVQGWRHAEGLWQPNTLVHVQGASLRLDADLLLTTVLYKLDEQGSTSTLTLTRADAFTLLPMKAAGGSGAKNFWGLPKAAGAN